MDSNKIKNMIRHSGDKMSLNYYTYISPVDKIQLHTHDVIEIILFLSGDISYFVDGRQYKVKENDIFIVAPSVYHRVKIESSSNYERYDILIDESLLPDGLVKDVFKGSNLVVHNATPEVKNIFDRLIYYCKFFESKAVDNFTVLLITELFYNLLYTRDGNQHTSFESTNKLVRDALDYIERNITTIKNPDEIYTYLKVSKSSLYRSFYSELSVNPMEYVRNKRLAIARRELHAGKKATDVFIDCGFSCYTTFYRAYLDCYGYPPSEEINKNYPEYVIKS